jgi:hypothetical protein
VDTKIVAWALSQEQHFVVWRQKLSFGVSCSRGALLLPGSSMLLKLWASLSGCALWRMRLTKLPSPSPSLSPSSSLSFSLSLTNFHRHLAVGREESEVPVAYRYLL